MVSDPIFCDDMVEVIRRYEYFLKLDEKELPKDFILQDILDEHG